MSTKLFPNISREPRKCAHSKGRKIVFSRPHTSRRAAEIATELDVIDDEIMRQQTNKFPGFDLTDRNKPRLSIDGASPMFLEAVIGLVRHNSYRATKIDEETIGIVLSQPDPDQEISVEELQKRLG